MPSVVSVVHTETYDPAALRAAVDLHFAVLNAAEDLKPGMKVLLKPNLLTARQPEQCVTTHPELLRAIVGWLRDHGITEITIADSPSGPYVLSALKSIYASSGMNALAAEAVLNTSTSWRTVPCPEGLINKSFNIIEPILEADYIINVPKLKTHAMTTISGGIKNLFGCIPGLQKPEMHYRFPDLEQFSNMLLELAAFVAPQITVVDAVEAMEGNGPNGGTPRHLGLTLASRDLFTQDWYAAGLIGVDPEQVSMLRQARDLGLAHPDELKLVSDTPVTGADFRLPDTVMSVDFVTMLPKFMRGAAFRFMNRVLKPVPKVNLSVCVGCGRCAESCPPQIIQIRNGKAKFTRKGCIACFCCQEMCPVHAIDAKRMINF